MLSNRSIIMYFVLLLAVMPLAGSAQVNPRFPPSPSQTIPPSSYDVDEELNMEGKGTLGVTAGRSASTQNSGHGHRYFDGSSHLRHDRIDPDENLNTIPYWTDSFDYHGLTYKYSMVGSDPKRGSRTTVIPTELIPLRFVFADGSVYDASTDIVDGQTAIQGIKNSPLFKNYDFVVGGTNVGNTQYGDAFQRANFWDSVSNRSPGYHVLLGQPTVFPVQTINVPADKASFYFDPESGQIIPLINEDFLEAQSEIIMGQLNISTRTLPILIWGRTMGESRSYPGETGAGAWHGALRNADGSIQTHIGTSYFSQAIFGGYQPDVYGLSHEVLEWLDDPFINNYTPGWIYPFLNPIERCDSGFVQDLLEVGDPVEIFGEAIVPLPAGSPFTYHVTEGMFLDYYTRRDRSRSVNGQYSFFEIGLSPYGLLTGPSLPCTGHVELQKTYIEYPGAVRTGALGINNRGDVVGYYVDTAGSLHGFLLKNSRFISIDPPGSFGTYAYKLNDSSEVVGLYYDSTGLPHGFYYRNGSYSRINFPSATDTIAYGINSNGDIVGSYDNTRPITHGFTMRNGRYQTTDTPYGTQTQVSDINDRNEITGFAWTDPAGPYAGFLRSHNRFSPFAFPSASDTFLNSLNNMGDLTGQFYDPDGSGGAFVTVYGHPYQVYLAPYGNNDLGKVVGQVNIGTASASHIVGVVGELPLARSSNDDDDEH